MREVNRKNHGVVGNFESNDEVDGPLPPEPYAMASAILSMRKRRRLVYLEHGLEVGVVKAKEVKV